MFTKQTRLSTLLQLNAAGMAVAATLLASPAIGHAQTPMAPMTGASASSSPAMPTMDMKKSMESMHQQMSSMQMTGDADHDFAMMMRIHHQGAVEMAQAELANGKDPQMRKMARNIIAAQKKEIAELDRWLKKHETSGKKSPSK